MKRSPRASAALWSCALMIASTSARAATTPADPDPERDALVRTLEAPIGGPVPNAGAALELPPLPPRRRGLSVEASVGALGFVSKLRTVSPMASRFRLQLGFDVLRSLMIFANGELAFTSSRYQPPARAYTIVALGGGVRATLPLGDRLGAYLQGELGITEVTSNVLHSYGYFGAEDFALYVGGQLGLEWYALDPHYAVSASGGVRSLPGFSRSVGVDSGFGWLASAAIRYTF